MIGARVRKFNLKCVHLAEGVGVAGMMGGVWIRTGRGFRYISELALHSGAFARRVVTLLRQIRIKKDRSQKVAVTLPVCGTPGLSRL